MEETIESIIGLLVVIAIISAVVNRDKQPDEEDTGYYDAINKYVDGINNYDLEKIYYSVIPEKMAKKSIDEYMEK